MASNENSNEDSIIPNIWRLNIPIGSKVVIDYYKDPYIFYGYNYDQSRCSCFPVNSASINDNMIFVPINAILAIQNPKQDNSIDSEHKMIEKQIEKININ